MFARSTLVHPIRSSSAAHCDSQVSLVEVMVSFRRVMITLPLTAFLLPPTLIYIRRRETTLDHRSLILGLLWVSLASPCALSL